MQGNSPKKAAVTPEQVEHHHDRIVLFVVAVALMAVISAVSGLNVALPQLARATGASQTQLTWIVDAYTVVFAGLLLLAGALGDRYGRRRLLAGGLAVFGGAAAVATFVDSPSVLIVLRMVMGVGAAAIMPTTLSVITTSFSEADRPRAVGVWVGVAAAGGVLGMFASGLLLEWFEWNSFFAFNVFLAALALIGTLRFVPESVDAEPPALDFRGAVLSLVAVSASIAGVIEGPEKGWTDTLTLGLIMIGLIAAIGFVLWELRAPRPLLDPRLFRIRGFSAGVLTITAQFFASFGLFFTLTQYLQFVVGYSPLRASVEVLALPIVTIPLARNAPRIAVRVGFRRLAPLGLLSSSLGLLVLSGMGVGIQHWRIILGLVFFGSGMALAGAPSTAAITASLPLSKQGVASAVNDTSREIGSAFGIAILGSLLNQGYRDGVRAVTAMLPPEAAEAVRRSVAVTQSPRIASMGAKGRAVVSQAHEAFVNGVHAATLGAAIVVACAALGVALLAPKTVSGAPRVSRR